MSSKEIGPVKRGRGRPRKQPPLVPDPETLAVPKRPRGRPRKQLLSAIEEVDTEVTEVIPKPSIIERLPTELRFEIYALLLSARKCDLKEVACSFIYLNKQISPTYHTAIFRVNKSIGGESRKFFYRENRFTIIKACPLWVLGRPMKKQPSGPVTITDLAANLTTYELKAQIDCWFINRKGLLKTAKVAIVAIFHLPLVVQQIRVQLLSSHTTDRTTIRFEVKPPFGRDDQNPLTTPSLPLQSFSNLARMGRVSFTGHYFPRQARALKSIMLSSPPVGPEFLAHARTIFTSARTSFYANHYSSARHHCLDLESFSARVVHKSHFWKAAPDLAPLWGEQMVYEMMLIIPLGEMYACVCMVKLGMVVEATQKLIKVFVEILGNDTGPRAQRMMLRMCLIARGERFGGNDGAESWELWVERFWEGEFAEVMGDMIRAYEVQDVEVWPVERRKRALKARMLSI